MRARWAALAGSVAIKAGVLQLTRPLLLVPTYARQPRRVGSLLRLMEDFDKVKTGEFSSALESIIKPSAERPLQPERGRIPASPRSPLASSSSPRAEPFAPESPRPPAKRRWKDVCRRAIKRLVGSIRPWDMEHCTWICPDQHLYAQAQERKSKAGTGAVMAGSSFGRFSIRNPLRKKVFRFIYSQVNTNDCFSIPYPRTLNNKKQMKSTENDGGMQEYEYAYLVCILIHVIAITFNAGEKDLGFRDLHGAAGLELASLVIYT